MTEPVKIDLRMVTGGDDLNLDARWRERQAARDELEYATITGGTQPPPSPGGDAALETAAQTPLGQKAGRSQPPQEAQPQIELGGKLPELRKQALDLKGKAGLSAAADKAIRSLSGGEFGLDDLTTEQFGEKLSRGPLTPGDVLPLTDPVGNLVGSLTTERFKAEGLSEEDATSVGTLTALAASILFPGGKGGKAAKFGTNVARVEAAADVKTVMRNLNLFNEQRLAQSRKVVTHEATIAASRGAMTLEEALGVADDAVLSADKMTALRDHYNAASTYLTDLAKRTAAGDTAAAAELPTAFTIAGQLAAKDEAIGRNVARGLESRKILSQAERAPLELANVSAMAQTIGLSLEQMDPNVLAQRLLSLNKQQRETLAKQSVGFLKTGQNALYELWINMLLSGPKTHVANTVSNAVTAAWAPSERALAAMLDFGKDRSVFFGESAAMLKGAIEGVEDGVRIVGKSLATGEGGIAQKVEYAPAITAQAFGFQPDTVHGAAIDMLGVFARTPTRVLLSEDEFFKAVNFRMELRALAFREARQEGLSGEALTRRVAQIIADPPAAVKANADKFKLTQTFNREFDEMGFVGSIGETVASAANNHPMLRVLVPFVRTPTNILHFASERTPVLNLLSDTLRADIAAGGDRRAFAFAKLAESAMVAGVFAGYAAVGDAEVPFMTPITGGGPKNRAQQQMLREQGWQPYSVRIGGQYLSYNRLDPMGMMLGIVADYAEIAGQIPEDQRSGLVMAMGLALSKNLVSKTYMEGLSNMLEALESPDRSGGKVAQGLARSVVPAVVRQVERSYDPTLRSTMAEPTGTAILTEMQTLLNEIRAGIPGFSDSLPPRRNLWGDPIVLPPGWGMDLISPVYASTVKSTHDDPVTAEIIKQRVALTLPPMAIGPSGLTSEMPMTEQTPGRPIKLTPEEYDRLTVLTGKGIEGHPPLKEALQTLITSSGYQRLPEFPSDARAIEIRRIVNQYKEAAKLQLRRESPKLDDAIRQETETRLRSRMPDQPPAQPKPGFLENLTNTLAR